MNHAVRGAAAVKICAVNGSQEGNDLLLRGNYKVEGRDGLVN